MKPSFHPGFHYSLEQFIIWIVDTPSLCCHISKHHMILRQRGDCRMKQSTIKNSLVLN